VLASFLTCALAPIAGLLVAYFELSNNSQFNIVYNDKIVYYKMERSQTPSLNVHLYKKIDPQEIEELPILEQHCSDNFFLVEDPRNCQLHFPLNSTSYVLLHQNLIDLGCTMKSTDITDTFQDLSTEYPLLFSYGIRGGILLRHRVEFPREDLTSYADVDSSWEMEICQNVLADDVIQCRVASSESQILRILGKRDLKDLSSLKTVHLAKLLFTRADYTMASGDFHLSIDCLEITNNKYALTGTLRAKNKKYLKVLRQQLSDLGVDLLSVRSKVLECLKFQNQPLYTRLSTADIIPEEKEGQFSFFEGHFQDNPSQERSITPAQIQYLYEEFVADEEEKEEREREEREERECLYTRPNF